MMWGPACQQGGTPSGGHRRERLLHSSAFLQNTAQNLLHFAAVAHLDAGQRHAALILGRKPDSDFAAPEVDDVL